MMSRRLRAPVFSSVFTTALILILTTAHARQTQPAPILIDYPAQGSFFPPEITAPTFLWRETADSASFWRIEVDFADGTPPLHLNSRGDKMQVGEIDSSFSGFVPPELSPQQAAAHTWKPDRRIWALIKAHSVERPATVIIRGLGGPTSNEPVSRGEVAIRTSKDPVGAGIFYRDVPLIPVPPNGEKGVIRPLPESAVPLIKWRLRYLDEPRSKVVMENLPTCANCHSFSGDGKTLGIDVDGPVNDKALYGLLPVKKITTISKDYVIRWSAFSEKDAPKRFGFMSQVSPDGRYVVNSIEVPGDREVRMNGRIYQASYVHNYGFGQVFFPTRGVLAWYSRESGKLQPLPGADDPKFVHCGAFWSPDGKYLVFSMAEARDPFPPGQPMSQYANSPDETQIQYDLYRMPFNNGKGGTAERIVGASQDGMSNDFPKVSPDGKWIVYVRNKNGLLMRPDSELWMVPFAGGAARRMNCNLSRMNSWHSFSPNGRWLVFSSKSRTLYTQMFLTHIDENGNDSPAILIDDSTAANRAVNIPEFVKIPKGGLDHIDAPVTEFYRIFTQAYDTMKKDQFAEAAAMWRKALQLDPDDGKAHYNLAVCLTRTGHPGEALPEYRRACDLNPDVPLRFAAYAWALALADQADEAIINYRQALAMDPSNSDWESQLGVVLFGKGLASEAFDHLNKAVEMEPDSAEARNRLGGVLIKTGQTSEAIVHLERAVELKPDSPEYRFQLGYALAQVGKLPEAIVQYRKSLELGAEGAVLESELGVVLFETGQTAEAVEHLNKAITLDPGSADAYNKLGTALAGTGQVHEAEGHLRKAVELKPESLEYRFDLAFMLVKDGDFAEAIPHLQKAVELSGGKDWRCLAMLGTAYGNTGHPAEARKAVEKALDLAEKDNNPDLVKTLRTALERYQQPK
jgi:Flp pilus assembly protein TadD